MNGLKTGRVVIIDNEEKDIFPILMGLSSLSVALTAFHINDDYEAPKEKLSGIRVVFLDLRLGSGGMGAINSGDFREAIARLTEIAQLETGLTGIICWSNHADHVEEFRTLLASDLKDFKPAFVEGLDKGIYIEDPDKLIKEIQRLTSQNVAFSLQLQWEQKIHGAASRVSKVLDVDNPSAPRLLQIQAMLAKSVTGQKECASPEEGLSAYYEAMNSIMLDALSDHDAPLPPVATDLLAAITALGKQAFPIGPSLNSLALVDRRPIAGCRTGNLYLASTWGAAFPFEVDAQCKRKLCYSILMTKEEMADSTKKHACREIFNHALICCVDVTPACDYAQRKGTLPRLVCGFLVKLNGSPCPLGVTSEARDYARGFGPFEIHNVPNIEPGIYRLVLNARYFTTEKQEALEGKSPALRIRTPVMVDFAAWLASHIARPGYTSFTS